MRPTETVQVFKLQTVLQNSSGPVAFILRGPCKEHSEKEVSRKNSEGKGYRVRAARTPIIKSSFRILPVYQILVYLMNCLF